jgi:hypothetical protein
MMLKACLALPVDNCSMDGGSKSLRKDLSSRLPFETPHACCSRFILEDSKRSPLECNLLESSEKAVYAVSMGARLVEIGGELRMKRAGLWAARATSILCLLLLTWMTFIQVTHVHPVASDTDHCPICVAMHTAAPAAVVVEPIQLVNGPEALPAPVMRSVIRRWPFTLFNRPPPEKA